MFGWWWKRLKASSLWCILSLLLTTLDERQLPAVAVQGWTPPPTTARRRWGTSHSHRRLTKSNEDDIIEDNCVVDDRDDKDVRMLPLRLRSRRKVLQHLLLAGVVVTSPELESLRTTCSRNVAHAAGGLIVFPLQPQQSLNNRYIFMRSGQTQLEEDDIISTNPLFITNRESGLSELGKRQVQAAAKQILTKDYDLPSVIKYSFAASSMDTAELMKSQLQLGQNRVVPEFNFMDPRAVGLWDKLPLSQVQPALVALDELEAGRYGQGGRTPPNDDGTPHETLADVVVRLQQLISLLETNYSGDTILLVFPDGTSPALLQCLLAGIPVNKVHVLDYQPGEIKTKVMPNDTLKEFEVKSNDDDGAYATMLARGKDQLSTFRAMSDEDIVQSRPLSSSEQDDVLREQERIQAEERQRQRQAEHQQREEAARLEAQRRREEAANREAIQRQRQLQKARRIVSEREDITEMQHQEQGASGDLDTSRVDIGVGIGAVAVFLGLAGILGTQQSDGDTDGKISSTTHNFTSPMVITNDSIDGTKVSLIEIGDVVNDGQSPTENEETRDLPPDPNPNSSVVEMEDPAETMRMSFAPYSANDGLKGYEGSKLTNNDDRGASSEKSGGITDMEGFTPYANQVSPKMMGQKEQTSTRTNTRKTFDGDDDDDGASAWLRAMGEILNEIDEDDDNKMDVESSDDK